jgi:hypothetical protein
VSVRGKGKEKETRLCIAVQVCSLDRGMYFFCECVPHRGRGRDMDMGRVESG